MKTIAIKSKSWKDVTQHQLLQLVPLIFGNDEKQVAQLKALLVLYPALAQSFDKLTAEQLLDALPLTDFVFQESFDIPIIKKFTLNNQVYLLPDMRLNNASFLEWAYADVKFTQFTSNTTSVKELNELVATLCRQQKKGLNVYADNYNGDKRVVFNPDVMELRAPEFEKVPLNIRMYVLMFFSGCKKSIVEQFPLWEQDADQPNDETPEQKQYRLIQEQMTKKVPTVTDWLQVMYEVAELRLFGNFQEVQQTNVHLIFDYLTKKRKQIKEQMRQMKAA